MESVSTTPSASVEARLEIPEGACSLTYQALDVEEIISSVGDDGAGATAVFIGTTRNSFKGKAGSYYARVSVEFTFNREGCHSGRGVSSNISAASKQTQVRLHPTSD